jgi:ArsR family transcriptional regulator, arsenate/arsenite/antimonite-responsive transcriptional repressor
MMSDSSAQTLGTRLERLTGEDPSCCLPRYTAQAQKVRRQPAFSRALARARSLADPKRLLALALLRRQPELCACELQAALEVSHATVSHHMRLLGAAGWVRSERRGKWMYYRLRPDASVEVP